MLVLRHLRATSRTLPTPLNHNRKNLKDNDLWGIQSPDDGLYLLRIRGLKILCWTVVLAIPLLIVRDVFASGLGSEGAVVMAIFGIRCIVLAMSAYVLTTLYRGREIIWGPVPFAHLYFGLLIVMVLLTIAKLGGSSSPVYAGLVTVMYGWCYFFVFGLHTTVPIFLVVVTSYLLVLGVFLGVDAMLSEEAGVRASLLCAVGLLVCVAGARYRTEQYRRFDAIIRQRELAGHDPLTQVLNRFALRDRYQAALDRATRHDRELSLLLIDIDDFKKINDSQGHAVGDEVLKTIATILDSESQERGQVGRWGGEEFVVLLPGFGRQAAEDVAEAIRKRCESTPFRSPLGKLRVTVSIGISSLEKRRPAFAHLVTEADQALYKAKADGKNCVCSTLLRSDSPETEKDNTELPGSTVRQLTPGDVSAWSRKLAFKGYRRFAGWAIATLATVSIGLIPAGPGAAVDGISIPFSQMSALLTAFLVGTYLLARHERALWFIRILHFVMPVAIAAVFSLLAVITGGSTSPVYILVMAVLILSSFTSPGGWRTGLPTFATVCLVWPHVMVACEPQESAQPVIVRATIITVLGIVCTLAHQMFHEIRYQAVRLDRHLELMGTRDSLTGLENRRAFNERFKHECAVALREQSELSLVLVDMNELKRINDSYGHGAGDKALLKLVSVMSQFVRSSDIVARLGGDEFALLLPETKLDGAALLMDRIDKQLDVERVSLPSKDLEVTAACGIAHIDLHATNLEKELQALTKRADAALYAAKEKRGAAIGVHDGSDIKLIELWSDVRPVSA